MSSGGSECFEFGFLTQQISFQNGKQDVRAGFDRTKSVLLPSHENELGHSVDHRESYREMFTRKDRLGNREFPWPRVHPLGYGESFLFTKTK